ncbi:MAG: uncharacterized protein KVP18_002473 [Porospora cf. gigantea A]|uniref:uncharacterized protein n=3 Tax=Porospora cf. gigantea A TaxID=2853593 RepID=UPI00355A5D9E|nr:MAG: hypothetical protein KVP18_002473 [Porospora cf. gigantea A]
MPAFFVVNSENHAVLELDHDGLMNLLRKQTRAALSAWELGRMLSATEAESASLRVHEGCFLVVMPPVVGLVASDLVVLRAAEQLDMGQVLQCIYRNFSILADSKRGLPACVGLGVKRSLPFVQEYRLPEGPIVVRQHLAMAHLDVLLIALVQDIDLRIRKWEDTFTHHITQTEHFRQCRRLRTRLKLLYPVNVEMLRIYREVQRLRRPGETLVKGGLDVARLTGLADMKTNRVLRVNGEYLLQACLGTLQDFETRALHILNAIQSEEQEYHAFLLHSRNRIIGLDLEAAAVIVGLAVPVFATGLLGMNLRSGLESSPEALYYVIVFSVLTAAIVTSSARLALVKARVL